MAIIEPYIPAPPPQQASAEVRQYLDQETRRIADALSSDTILVSTLAAAPSNPSNGMMVYADGTSWNPGSGEGFYGYEGGTWVKL